MPKIPPLSLMLFSGSFDRVHYALAAAAAAAATGRAVTVLVAGRALHLLLAGTGPGAFGWHALDAADDGSPPVERDRFLAGRGVAKVEELLGALVALEVRLIACEMGLRALDTPAAATLRADLPATIGGIVGFLNHASGGDILFV